MTDGLLESPLFKKNISQVIVGLRKIGVCPQRLGVMDNSLLEPPLFKKNISQVIVHFRKTRL